MLVLELIERSSLVSSIILNSFLLAVAWVLPKKLLTPAGYLNAWLLGVLVWLSGGYRAYIVVMFYFLIGSAVTRLGLKRKEAFGIAEKRSGQRGPANVWGSAATAALCALGVLSVHSSSWLSLLWLGYVASLSTKLSDTAASEVGKAYGKRTFLITTLRPVPAGTEGAVSLEGTLAGVIASIALSSLGYWVGLTSLLGIIWCIVSAFIATNIESLIGATLQSKWSWLSNELVNVVNTLIGAIVAIVLAGIWGI
jgi:uncharacterized protein (TIGR00297 family)